MSYLIVCKMPGCEWRSRQAAEYLATENLLLGHVLRDHTQREIVEALVSCWQYGPDGHRVERDDPLTYIAPVAPSEPVELMPTPEPRRRRSKGRKAKYAKTYAQMIREAFAGHPPGAVLTTGSIKEYMGGVTQAIIPTASVSATLHKMCEENEVEHVAQGQWKWLHGEAH